MKQIIITLLCLTAFASVVRAENRVTLSTVDGHPGDVVSVALSLENTDAVTAFEAHIPLPEALTYVDGSCVLNTERSNGHDVSAAVVDGELRIYVYSLSLKSLNGTNGELLRFGLKLGKEPADYALQPVVLLSDAAGKKTDGTATNGTVTLLSPKLNILTPQTDYGRVPIRGHYDQTLLLQNVGNEPLAVSDIVCNHATLAVAESDFVMAVGETKSVTLTYSPVERGSFESSVTIVSDAVNGDRQTAKVVAAPFSVNELHVQTVSGRSDETVTVVLRMNNMEPIVAAQCDIDLPEALVYEEGSAAVVSARGLNHAATASMTGNVLRLVAYSPNNTPFNANDGDLLTFRLRLNGRSGWYYLEPQNVVLGNKTMENMTSATSGNYVVIESPTFRGSETLSFGSTPVTEEAVTDYAVTNDGQAPLVVERVTFLTEGYVVKTPLPLTIEPYQSANIRVGHTPTTEGRHTTTMQIYTNDPECRMASVAVEGVVYEPNILSLSATTETDGSGCLRVALNNYSAVVAVQFDLHGLTDARIDESDIVKTERLSNHSVVVSKMSDTDWRVLIYSMSGAVITGNDGELLSLKINSDVKTTTTVVADGFVVSNKAGSDKNSTPTQTLPISYGQPPIVTGDLNGDTDVNVADKMALQTYILSGGTTNMNVRAADVNGDGEVNVADTMTLLSIILGNIQE